LVLLLAGATLAASLFLTWREPAEGLILFGAVDRIEALSENAWEHWAALDVVLAVVAAALVVTAVWANRTLDVGVGAAALLAAGWIALAAFGSEPVDLPAFGVGTVEAGPGPLLALAALAVGVAALARRTL